MNVEVIVFDLQRFALKSKPRKILKGLLRNPFKIFLVARLIDNCCKVQICGNLASIRVIKPQLR